MANSSSIKCNTDAFRMLRLARKLTRSELARRVGMDQSQIGRIEDGTHLPRVDHAIHIARQLRAKVEDLWPEAA